MYEYKATITNIVDGDTFDLCVDVGFTITVNIRARLLDMDTPEKFGKEKEYGLIMKDYAIRNFLGKTVTIKSHKDASAKTDSFGRWLVSVTLDNGESIVDIYNRLGVNKKCDNYSEQNVASLAE